MTASGLQVRRTTVADLPALLAWEREPDGADAESVELRCQVITPGERCGAGRRLHR
ncbi:hypothetical protein [Amycolatopsis jiangsuensis]|uniref:Uncharacterized protein n=1 Tax=Amycolatopsis jiangsuensis TaxID=1181879 RepID=A0A840INN9_9PSEU|nr:hypothetical protein [Amycolatopsis jiangsuensis]MBB4683503.1 hypothetical protein [Amycolatopsis jiangsuensis]